MIRLDLEKSTSVHVLPLNGSRPEPELQHLEVLIEYSAQLLPPSMPIGGFAFQNPLHALEYLPFDDAVQVGSRLFGCQPYLPEAKYRQALERGRIQEDDLRAILEEDPQAGNLLSRLSSRLHLRMTMLRTPLYEGTGSEVEWRLAETDVLCAFPRRRRRRPARRRSTM